MPRALSLALLCLAAAPLSAQTFVDRQSPGDLRVVSYNVLWDTIFPSVNPSQADKFERVVRALDADVWALQEIDYDTSLSAVLDLMDDIQPVPGGWQGHKEGDCVIVSRLPLSMKAGQTIPAGDKGQAMALIDLPDDRFAVDLYMMNNHYKCCGGFDWRRQEQSDAIVSWMRDARTPGGFIDLPQGTAMMVVGDLNIVDGFQPVQTLIDGDIIDEATFGPDSPPDWDGSDALDVRPLHNGVGPADWTWYTPGPYPPGRLDYIITTDSVLAKVQDYALNTTIMSPAELAAAGLQANDVTIDQSGQAFDHLPLVADFRGEPDAFTDVGQALPGLFGTPLHEASGSLTPGSSVTLTLSAALPASTSALVLGVADLSVPFKGGVLVPTPDVIVPGLTLSGTGAWQLVTTWPGGLPSGVSFWSQHWIVDPTGPAGFTASNALRADVP